MLTLRDIQNLNRPGMESNLPTQTLLTIHRIRSAPPFEFDVYSNTQIDYIPDSPGVFCLATPQYRSSLVCANDWLFSYVASTNKLKEDVKAISIQPGYDPSTDILVYQNLQNPDEHLEISVALQKEFGWYGISH